MTAAIEHSFEAIAPDGGRTHQTRMVAVEMPVAIEVNGIGYAVMMATPADLEDFAVGFALGERLVDSADDVLDTDVHETPNGIVLRVTVAAALAERVLDRARHRVAESSCGLCGIENLEQALRPLPPVTPGDLDPASLFRATAALRDHQPLNRATGAVHAAARCRVDGTIVTVREDVGRHNAFDKLIGAMRRAGEEWDGGFALLTSRCSYDLVEKAALSGCPTLVTVSAATSLALERARECGLRLVTLARADSVLVNR